MKKKISSQALKVLREAHTEAPFTGALLHNKKEGAYYCAYCGNKLFESGTKFDSGTGWPSFNNAIPGSVRLKTDYKLIIPRTEVTCVKCESHLGHVFNDGPKPTGKRYCINSLALNFKKRIK